MAFCDFHYFSDALGKQTAAYVLLPETGKPPYPTLYLLHGYSDDHTIWLRRTRIEEYVAQMPLMVVMPDGGHGFYADAAEGYAFGKAIGEELLERIERTFPAQTHREGRCIAGLSMGGYGALRLALAYPERFGAAVSHSGAVAFGHNVVNHSGEPYLQGARRILGADHVGGPNDLFALAEKTDPAILPALRIDCGVDDFLYKDNQAFHAFLTEKGIPHEYEEFPGAHNWDYWDLHIRETLTFFKKVMAF